MPSISKIKDEKFNALYEALLTFLDENFRPENSNFNNPDTIKNKADSQLTRLKIEFENSQRVSKPNKPYNIFASDTTNRDSLLHRASEEGNNLMIRFLINAGEDIDRLNTRHESALYTACLYLQETTVDLLLNLDVNYDAGLREAKKLPLYITIDPENTALDESEKIKAANILKKLIDGGIDINQPLGRSSQFRAIHYAVMDRRKLLVKTIVESDKADLDIVDADGNTVLHMIADYRDQSEKLQESLQMQEEREIAELIIPHIKNFDAQDNEGDTSLHKAVTNSNVQVVDAIVKRDYLFPKKKILNIKNNKGLTALHIAVLEAHRGPKILDLLIRLATQDELGIKSDLEVNGRLLSNAGETALEMANRLINDVDFFRQSASYLETTIYALENMSQSRNALEWKRILSDKAQGIYNNLGRLSSITSANLLPNLEPIEEIAVNLYGDARWTVISEVRLNQQVASLSFETKKIINHINLRFDSNYLHALNDAKKSLEQTDFFAWKAQQLSLESSFNDLERISPNYYMELAQANNKFREALLFLERGDNVSAQKKLEESISFYDSLKEYSSLETAYEYLASTYINVGDSANYEARNQAKLFFSSNNAKLHGHFALAGLYKVLKARNLTLLPSISADDLNAYESFHYSEAYKLTQGNLDNEAHVVLQREIGVAHNIKLGTSNIQQCVAVIAHDANTGKVILAHFDKYSGPLKFIDLILNEFPTTPKIDLYLTGGRDRVTTVSSTSTTKVSDNNINQVLKQIYAHKERFNIKASDLGDKPAPAAVIFNVNTAKLEHAIPNHEDVSLNSRAAMMLIELKNEMMQKGDYLYPLSKVDIDLDERIRKKSFSSEQLQTIKDQYYAYKEYYKSQMGYSEAWKNNQLYHPLIATIQDATNSKPHYNFERGLFRDLTTQYHASGTVQLPFDFDISFLQQNIQPHPDLINEISTQNCLNSLHVNSNQQANRDEWVIDGDELNNIDTGQDVDIDDIDMEPPNKRSCLSNRRRREAEACAFSWEDIDKINIEKEKPRDIEKINIDSTALLEHLKGADELTRSQLLQFAANSRMTGDRQSIAQKLISIERLKPHLQKVSKISFGLTQGIFAEDAFADLFKGDPTTAINLAGLMSVSHGLGKLAKWITKNPVNKLLKLSTPFMRRGTSILNGFDLVKQINALKNGNEDAIAGIVGDSVNIGIDLAEAGIEIAELSSETMALLSLSTATGPIGELAGAIVMVSVKIFNAVRSVDRLDHVVHLSGWEKFKEGWRAVLGISREAYIQEIVDLKKEYERILLEKLEVFKNHSEIKHIIFTAIEEIGKKCRVIIGDTQTCSGGGRLFPPKCTYEETVCEPVFAPTRDSYVNFYTKRNNFKLVREKPTSPAGSQLVCLPTGDYLQVTEPTYRCDSAIGITNTNTTGNIAFFDLGPGDDDAVGFLNQINFFMVNDGFKKYKGGKEADLFFIQGSKVEGDFDGREGIDTLDISGFQPTIAGPIEIHLNNYMAYDNKTLTLGLRNIENLIDEPIDMPREKSIVVACKTTNLKLQGGTLNEHDKIHIPQDDNCLYSTNITLQAHTDVINEAKKGSFRYNIQPKNGEVTVYFSVHTPALPELSNQFVFDIPISELVSLQHTTTNTALPMRHDVKFHFGVEIDNFKLKVRNFLNSNTPFYFKNGEQLKIGDKNIYLFHYTEESIENIINNYLPIAGHLKVTCFIHTLRNEVVIIGHDKHEVMQNDPSASATHLLGNGGENIFVIESGAAELPLTPISTVNLYQLENGNHIDTLDLRTLSAQVQAKLNMTPEIVFIPPNEQNRLGNDLLLLLVIKTRHSKSITELMNIRLKNGINWYQKLHVVLNVSPQKIVGSLSNLSLAPLPLVFKEHHETISISSKDIEKHTKIYIPRKLEQYAFFRDGDHLRMTNVFSHAKKIKPITVLFENYFNEPKLATLSISFSNNGTIVLANKSTEISAAPNFEERWLLRQKAWSAIAFNQTNRDGTDINSAENNQIISRQRRSVELSVVEPIASSSASRSGGIIQSVLSTVKGAVNILFFGNAEPTIRTKKPAANIVLSKSSGVNINYDQIQVDHIVSGNSHKIENQTGKYLYSLKKARLTGDNRPRQQQGNLDISQATSYGNVSLFKVFAYLFGRCSLVKRMNQAEPRQYSEPLNDKLDQVERQLKRAIEHFRSMN